MVLHWTALIILLWCVTAILSPAPAQMIPASSKPAPSVEIPENLTQEQARDLVARLSDQEVRDLIIAQFDKHASAQIQVADAAYINQVRQGISLAVATIKRLFQSGNKLDTLPTTFWQQVLYPFYRPKEK